MRSLKVLAIATVFTLAGVVASAEEATVPPPERSISSEYILLGILSTLLIWAAVEAQD